MSIADDGTTPTRDPEIDGDGEVQARAELLRAALTGRQMAKLEFLRWLYPRLVPAPRRSAWRIRLRL